MGGSNNCRSSSAVLRGGQAPGEGRPQHPACPPGVGPGLCLLSSGHTLVQAHSLSRRPSPSPVSCPAGALRAPGLEGNLWCTHRDTKRHTLHPRGLKRISPYLPLKGPWLLLLPGSERPEGGLGCSGGELPRTAGRGVLRAPCMIGRGFQAIWKPHLQTCLAWISRPLVLEGHTRMVFTARS